LGADGLAPLRPQLHTRLVQGEAGPQL
jgi:hypothetical protein